MPKHERCSHQGNVAEAAKRNFGQSDVRKASLRDHEAVCRNLRQLYRREKLYYVGLTTNLHGRIRWHLKDRHKGKWDKFIIFRIQKVAYLKDIETLIHHIVDLPGNKVKGKVPKDADLNQILREVLRDHEKAIKGIKTALK